MRIHAPQGVPPIPGLKYWGDSLTADGSVDALEAAGVYHGKAPPPLKMVPPPGVEWRPYQVDGITRIYNMLKQHKGALLADDMGLGKTPQGAAVATLLNQPTLVVCPAGVRHQWAYWLTKLTGKQSSTLGPPSDKEFLPEWGEWKSRQSFTACVSYQLMHEALKTRLPGTILFDEPHNYLQGRANTYVKVLWKYGGAITYKLMLTGTPYLSKPAGLWQMLNIILGHRFGKAREFDIRYCNGHQGEWGWVNAGISNSAELAQRLSHYMVRRMKAEVASELPKVTRTIRWCDADAKATGALAQAPHTVVGLRGAVRATLKGKDKDLLDLMEGAQENGVCTTVFTWMREDAHHLGNLLTKNEYPCIVITGEDSAAERARMVEIAFQQKLNVVTTYGASGQGLDGLQRWISNAIFHAIDPVPAILLQASGRHDRIGQKMPVTETYLAMRESVDELTVDKVVNRLGMWEQLLGKDKSSTEVKKALASQGMDPNDDDVLNAIFKEMTNG